jgi:hypothetical protein
MECVPEARLEVVSAATPLLTVSVANDVAPSRKFTVPVAEVGVIVAVNVTACPWAEGFVEEPKATLEPTLFTVCVTAAETLAALALSPE